MWSRREDLGTPLLQIPQVSELGDVASRIDRCQKRRTERLTRGPVEAGDSKVSFNDGDRKRSIVSENFDGVEGAGSAVVFSLGAPRDIDWPLPGESDCILYRLSRCGVQLATTLQYGVKKRSEEPDAMPAATLALRGMLNGA